LDQENERFVGLATVMARLLGQTLSREIASLGLAPAQLAALEILWQDDALTQSDLMLRVGVEQATMANTLARMERDGLVRRAPHPEDGRAQVIHLTETARSLEAPARAVIATFSAGAISHLPLAERALFVSMLERMVEGLRQAGSGG